MAEIRAPNSDRTQTLQWICPFCDEWAYGDTCPCGAAVVPRHYADKMRKRDAENTQLRTLLDEQRALLTRVEALPLRWQELAANWRDGVAGKRQDVQARVAIYELCADELSAALHGEGQDAK